MHKIGRETQRILLMMCPLPCYNNSVHFTVFEKTQKSLIQHLASQTVLPDRSILKEKKIGGKFQNSN